MVICKLLIQQYNFKNLFYVYTFRFIMETESGMNQPGACSTMKCHLAQYLAHGSWSVNIWKGTDEIKEPFHEIRVPVRERA